MLLQAFTNIYRDIKCLIGAPEEIRTPDPQIRSLVLAQHKKNHITGRITYELRACRVSSV